MSAGDRYASAKAKEVALELIALLKAPSDKLTLAGSLRRGKPDVGDVEIVFLPEHELDPEGEQMWAELDDLARTHVIVKRAYGGGVYRWGQKYRGFVYEGIPFEMEKANPHNYGYKLWLRTGEAEANKYALQLLKAIGSWAWPEDGYWYLPEGDRISVPDEITMFGLLKLPYVEPALRTLEHYRKLYDDPTKRLTEQRIPKRIFECRTGRINCEGSDKMDITIKSAKSPIGELLAPTWDMVMAHKDGRLSDHDYTRQYYDLIRKRYMGNKHMFASLFQQGSVTLTCYCNAGEFCHRHLAVDILAKLAGALNVPFEYMGEVTAEDKPKQLNLL